MDDQMVCLWDYDLGALKDYLPAKLMESTMAMLKGKTSEFPMVELRGDK